MKQLMLDVAVFLTQLAIGCAIFFPMILLSQAIFSDDEIAPEVIETSAQTYATAETVDIEDAEPLPTYREFDSASTKATEFSAPIEPIEEITEAEEPQTEASTEGQALFDVPLSEDLQCYIIRLCEQKHIQPEIVIAMIARESNFNASACGDNGYSHGLMQIQPRFCRDLMDKLNCNDLFDPYQNVTVGIEILSDKLNTYGGNIAKALTAYNAGDAGAWNLYFSEGVTASPYAISVMSYAETLS